MFCYINNQKYSIDPDSDFSDKETWQIFASEVRETNEQMLIPMKELIEKDLVNACDGNNKVIPNDQAVLSLQNMINDNNWVIELIEFKLME